MMEQVKLLIDLQEVMGRARRLDEEKQKIPLEVADLKSLFEEREAAFLAAEQEFETLKQQRRDPKRRIGCTSPYVRCRYHDRDRCHAV